jgi:flagellar biosynthesis protein FlhG
MPDFYPSSRPMPLDLLDPTDGRVPQDQADGLRRLFAGRRRAVLPLVANPHVAFGGIVLDRVAAALAAQGRQVLVVDAATNSPPPAELAAVDLALCIETLAPQVAYLAAGGLATAYVDTRGDASGLIDAAQRAHPAADVVVVHADAMDLARIFKFRAARPMLLGADHPESIKHAYAGAKLLATRCDLLTFDLLLALPARSPRATAIVQSLASCAENFLGALLVHHALIDPAQASDAPVDADLARLLAAQLGLEAAGAVPSVAAPPPVSTTVARYTPKAAAQAAPKTLSPAAGPRRAVAQR